MKRMFATGVIVSALFTSVHCVAADDVMDRIKQLELQIQELKQLKEQQAVSAVKYDDCMKAFGREKFCACISTTLPRQVSFENYIHTMITPREVAGFAAVAPDQRAVIEATVAARDSCIEKGFFK